MNRREERKNKKQRLGGKEREKRRAKRLRKSRDMERRDVESRVVVSFVSIAKGER